MDKKKKKGTPSEVAEKFLILAGLFFYNFTFLEPQFDICDFLPAVDGRVFEPNSAVDRIFHWACKNFSAGKILPACGFHK